MPPDAIDTVVFDLGGVLIDWNPRYLYRQLFDGDEEAMEAFLANVCTPEWNAEQDRGRAWTEAVESLALEHPDQRDLIAAYHERWEETLGDAVPGTVDIVTELRQTGVRLLVLSNWSAETFPIARARFPFLDDFDGIIISGDIRAGKPDAAAFRALLDRFEVHPASTVFIDDSDANVAAASALGMIAIRFVDAPQLRTALKQLGLLVRGSAED